MKKLEFYKNHSKFNRKPLFSANDDEMRIGGEGIPEVSLVMDQLRWSCSDGRKVGISSDVYAVREKTSNHKENA